MIDPNNVLIRCPNGHELQAAKSDIHKTLTCPVCNTPFTPAAQEEDADRATHGTPTLGYAPGMLSKPIRYPAYTHWMLGIWAALITIQTLAGYYRFIRHGADDAVDPSAGSSTVLLLFCFSIIGFGAVLIMQLMWIYRIHADAKRTRQYQAVSPGLALGLSFIPAFNIPWTAWCLKKLADFATSGEETVSSAANPARQATHICFMVGIVMGLAFCVTLSITGWLTLETLRHIQEVGPQNFDQAEYQATLAKKIPMAWNLLSPIVPAVGVWIYFWAVRRLEAVLYPFLGAPNR